jgi:HK97 family phage major capsid protein
MANFLDVLRSNRAALLADRDVHVATMAGITRGSEISGRTTLTADQTSRFDAAKAQVEAIDADLGQFDARIAELEAVQARTQAANLAPTRMHGRDWTWDGHSDARGAALSLVERGRMDSRSGDRTVALIDESQEFARHIATAADPSYESAFLKMLARGAEAITFMTPEEQAAWGNAIRTSMSVGSNTNGGFLVPAHLDPTIILTSSGWENPLRKLARVVTLTEGSTWNGVTSAGVVASFDAELTEVSDDTPTFARASIPVHKAQAFVQYSIESEQDIVSLGNDLLTIFGDAKGDLEASKYISGSGTNEPTGIVTALDANTNVEIISTTAATIGEVDLHSMYRQVPIRWRRRGTWLLNPVYSLAVKRLGQAVSSTFSGDLTQPVSDRFLGRPVVDDDDMPSTQTTTANDNEIIFGDFGQFVIVDKPGSMRVELIPHMFNTANNLPDGRRGLYCWWRTGSEPVVETAFRLLQDRTSA